MDSFNQLFDLFSRERRRYALYALDEADGPVEVEELADQIQEWEEVAEYVSSDDFDEVVLSLEHTHLPKAAQAEYIEYDRDEREIRISGESTEFQMILTVSEALEKTDQENVFDPDTMDPEEFLSQFSPASQTSK